MPHVATTKGIKIEVQTKYLEEYSKPAHYHYLFCYKVIITNESDATVQLLRRHWIIIDSNSVKNEVEGPGVIGKQPILEPGESHEYYSFSPLETDFGTMEGSYTFSSEGKEFEAAIPKFFLATNLSEFEGNKFKRGQIVNHTVYKYRGVVVDYDMYFMNDEKWYEENKTHPPKNEPWYYVLADGSNTVHYVAQENMAADENYDSEIENPLIEFFFSGKQDGKYVRNDKTWDDLQKH